MNVTGIEVPKPQASHSAPARTHDAESPIDFSRLFIAEELTPLFHTAAYAVLPAAARLRYNHLHAFYFSEQVSFFEQEMLSPALLALLRGELPPGLAEGLRIFYAEEQRHTTAFRALNTRCASELYGIRPYRFIRIPRLLMRIIHAVSARPQRFPLIFWLALLQEERSLRYSKICLDHAENLEPHFVAMHRAHLADEVGHVGWDEELLDWLWPRTGPATRRLNARLLGWMIGEYFSLPKRSAVRVIKRLAGEYPNLDARALVGAMQGLRDNPAYLQTLYSRQVTPRAFARFDTHPEFALLGRTLAGYSSPGFPA